MRSASAKPTTKGKKDAPSGTALALKQTLLEVDPALNVEIVSHREGDAVGIHTISARLGDDVIQIRHEALSRRSFAEGAVRAAEWLCRQNRLLDRSIPSERVVGRV